jgi:hypothetical protein
MSEAAQTYVDLCLSGKSIADDIDDYVSRWHESRDATNDRKPQPGRDNFARCRTA